VPSIIVSDRAGRPPPAGLALRVITLRTGEDTPTSDISFTQMFAVDLRIATAAFTTDIRLPR
jgi:hypothetical protein